MSTFVGQGQDSLWAFLIKICSNACFRSLGCCCADRLELIDAGKHLLGQHRYEHPGVQTI